jgi:hypothetical protein
MSRTAAGLVATSASLVLTFSASPAAHAETACTPISIDGVRAACVTLTITDNGDGKSQTGPVSSYGRQYTVDVAVSVDGSEVEDLPVPVTSPDPTLCAFAFNDSEGMSGVFIGVQTPYVVAGGSLPQDRAGLGAECTGAAIEHYQDVEQPTVVPPTITPPTVGETPVPYHVPQICLTTTGTCVGPEDGSLPEPTVGPPTVSLPSVSKPGADVCVAGGVDLPTAGLFLESPVVCS